MVMASPRPYNGADDLHNRNIRLTAVEETLRRLLIDVADHIEANPQNDHAQSQVSLPAQLVGEKTVLRFTGGWVRDKLLGVDSHDIDVAINNMTGYQFGLRMKEYLDLPGNLRKYGLEEASSAEVQSPEAGTIDKSKLVGGLHKIEANPEKSKHLETVTTRILGLDIDLVNLRKETYTEDSRNPQMEFGTPEEDALRRDATINAMFYNLNTLQIEDFTARGFEDMQNGIIRTPLEPYQTFKDDPLRVLRLIRFASRLGYSLDQAAAESMRNDDIKIALKVKISRERVGVELEKMLRGPDPLGALQMIIDAGLYKTVFSDPTVTENAYDPEVKGWDFVVRQAAAVLRSHHALAELCVRDVDERYTAWVLACLVPYRDAPQPQSPPGRRPPPPIATQVAREGFKATNKVCEVLTAAIKNSADISRLASLYGHGQRRASSTSDGTEREELGMAVRQWGSSWRLQTLFALFGAIADDPSQTELLFLTYESFVTRVEGLGLTEAYAFRPLLDGKQLAKAIGISGGPWMKDALDVVMKWQLRNPGVTDATGAIEDVKISKVHGELSADLIKHFLSLTIRPLFAKTQHPAVTAQGRKSLANSAPRTIDIAFDKEAAKPWKKKEHQALELLVWIIKNLDDESVERNWHLLIPPLLSIVDDQEVVFKARGCELITLLLQKTPSNLLAKTGLFDVFDEALLPCFGFLPTLTAEHESANLLKHAFPALLALHTVRHPPNTTTPLDAKPNEHSIRFLDALLRKGVFATYAHCSENVQISIVIIQNLCSINDALGLESVKHLKHSLPLLNEILCNPFGPASPELLVAAVIAVQSVIRNGWPRMLECRGEVLKGLCVSWMNVEESDHSAKFEEFRKQSCQAVNLLRQAIGEAHITEADFRSLMDADDRLEGLLGQTSS
ncbi:poly A polymerase C-terminal region-like protein [Myriangium duriaei CBS 260.36]|uniref:Poly A polymerase C-terminal region-like protein n=1 Tax=Myriangium duriaei CBS 260.36 TaxID=1168546 RepID=A0A9P4IUY6_9PEZI|nr:poly A polymerase C-terminal region-like protein [Myriangium duriaei CBS 260.36]